MADDLDFGETVRGFTAGQKVFGRFQLKSILGRGGMGVVWLARDESLDEDVALKFLPEIVAHDPAAVDELKRETRRARQLTHPHIVRVHDFVQDARSAAIAMEYIQGDSLAKLRVGRKNKCFEAGDIRGWLEQLCDALHYAHEKAKVVHRDIKPANLMIDARGDLKITDFGIARSVSDSVSRVSMQAGSSGTPVYMSPEQMMGERPAIADDVYATGATIFELLTGKPPFYSGNVILQVQNKVPPTMAARRAELEVPGKAIPEEWESLVAECLAKSAADRPASMLDVRERIGTRKPKRGSKGTAAADTPAAPVPVRGPDHELIVKVTAEQLLQGGPKELDFTRDGERLKFSVDLPPNSQEGRRLRLRGEGGPGQNGGEAGDLYLILQLDAAATPPPPVLPDPPPPPAPKPAPAKNDEDFTPFGTFLVVLFFISLAVWGAAKLDWLDRFDRPTPDTHLLPQGLEFNVTKQSDLRSVNGFYRVKDAKASLVLSGSSTPRTLQVRDRSFYKWGDIIEVQSNRWTGKTTSGAEPVTYRVAVEIPADRSLVGKVGTLSVDLGVELPVLTEGKEGKEFSNQPGRLQQDFPVKITASAGRDLSVRAQQLGFLLVMGLLVLGVCRAGFAVNFREGWPRGSFNFICLAVIAGVVGTYYFAAEKEYAAKHERVRAVAKAEEALAQDNVAEARRLVEDVLALDRNNGEAQLLLKRINATPVTFRVPGTVASVQEALKQAKIGDTIELAKGVYRGGVTVNKSVIIRGHPEGGSILEPSTEKSSTVLTIKGDVTVTLADLDLRSPHAQTGDVRHALINVEGEKASLLADGLILSKNGGHGMYVAGGAQATVRASQISGNGWSGLRAQGSGKNGQVSRIKVENCELFENDEGIRASNGAIVEVRGSALESNAAYGALALSRSKITVEESHIAGNGRAGLRAEGDGTTIVVSNSSGGNNRGNNTVAVDGARIEQNGNRWQ